MTNPQKIVILGAGRVGKVLGAAWARAGRAVTFAARDPDGEDIKKALAYCGKGVSVRAVAGSADGADIVVVALPWTETEAVIQCAGNLNGKVVIDVTNPVALGAAELSRGLLVGHSTSAAEEIARWAIGARVVKAFNTIGSANMANPQYGDQTLKAFMCGDDAPAKSLVAVLAKEVGLDPVDVGALKMARCLEPLAYLWVQLAYGAAAWGPNFAFDVIHRRMG